MPKPLATPHHERHRNDHIGWLRAAVLGANDGLISTSSLLVGIAAAGVNPHVILMTGIAGLTAGALSMAAGEYVSVSSQADTEAADLAREKRELAEMPEAELKELTHIYVQRGLSRELAAQVAEQLTAHDALAAHRRDELGMAEHTAARPVQAAMASAAAFAAGAASPLLLAWLWRADSLPMAITLSTLVLLAGLGALAAWLGGASMVKGAARVLFWGALAMGATALIGRLFGVSVA
ncbi:MAG: VIT family protein [Pseudomonadota bacterium]|nr:VIT family protein [Pseudomonadota bacterium]